MFRSIAGLIICLGAITAQSAVIEVNVTVSLAPSQIYNCLGDYGVTVPRCWVPGRQPSGQFDYPSFSPVTVEPGDTLRVVVSFADGYRLRWADDGLNIEPYYGDEFFGVTVLSSSGAIPVYGTFANSFSFTDPSGDLLGNDFAWNWSGGFDGLEVFSWEGGPRSLTDSYFEFSGFTSEFTLVTGSGLPATVDYVVPGLGSGMFSIIAPVPIPPAAWLFGSALGLMGWMRRKPP